ncbi:MAG: hypothetical protein DMG61_04470 [Acidobacteria bacterium]|nr:MAG: hypothetical protein DMG61_04470 [Acidobacteriota bacterium]
MVLASMAMHWSLQGALWLLGFLLQVTVAVAVFRFCLYKVFPLFFSYLVLGLVRATVLFFIRPHHPPYFYAYWISECLLSIFGFLVVEEIFRKAFEQRLGLQKLGTVLFRYSLLALVVTAVIVAAMAPGTDADRLVAAILVLKGAQSFVRIGLICCLFVFVLVLGLPWGDYVIGIATGFALYGAVELAATVARSHYGSVANVTSGLSIQSAGVCQQLVWIAYFMRARAPRLAAPTQNEFPRVAVEVNKMNEAIGSYLGR